LVKKVVHKKPKTETTSKPSADTTTTTSDATSSTAAVAGKSLRSSTARKREELEQKQQEREANRLKLLKKQQQGKADLAEIRRLTQEELLAEAKFTEQINLASLGECFFKAKPLFSHLIIFYHNFFESLTLYL
jgi:hypothetical protein